MAKPLSFKDFMIVDLRPGEPEEIQYQAHKAKKAVSTSEELSIQGRRKLARNMKRRKTQLKLARKRARKRLAKTDVLKRRSRRAARGTFADKLAGKGVKKSQLSVSKKKQIEKRLKQGGWQQRMKILQRRLMPKKRRAEISRKR